MIDYLARAAPGSLVARDGEKGLIFNLSELIPKLGCCSDLSRTPIIIDHSPDECGTLEMTKSELVRKLAEANPQLYRHDVEVMVTVIFEQITAALARGDRVELRGFGAFSVKRRGARIGRNPRTGASVQVAEKHIPVFKSGKQLRNRLNQPD